jgi:hypothetical protein
MSAAEVSGLAAAEQTKRQRQRAATAIPGAAATSYFSTILISQSLAFLRCRATPYFRRGYSKFKGYDKIAV